jgi:putative hemolysin
MEDINFAYRILLLLFIVGLNGFFASAEVALLSVRHSRLREMAEAGQVGAQTALNLRANPQRLLSVVQVGVTLASLGAGWAGEETVFRMLIGVFGPLTPPVPEPVLHAISFILAFLVLTFAMVVVGEVVPKNVAIDKADRYSVLVAPVLMVFYRVMEPFVFLLERSADTLSRMLGVRGEQRGSYSPEELKVIVEASHSSGTVPAFSAGVISRVLDLDDLTVREVMAPRRGMVTIPLDAPLDQILRVMIEYKYARVPVYDQTPESIVGILHYKDLLRVWEDTRVAQQVGRPSAPFQLRRVLKRSLVVPETKPLSQMLDEFREAHTHMALVVDEFGSIVGLVTLEDVLEQIVGEIEDEHDVRRHTAKARSDLLELDGATSIRDLATQFELELPVDAGFETLAGFLLYRFGDIPRAGDSVIHEDRRFTVLEMDRRRISRVRIEKIGNGPEPRLDGEPAPDDEAILPP